MWIYIWHQTITYNKNNKEPNKHTHTHKNNNKNKTKQKRNNYNPTTCFNVVNVNGGGVILVVWAQTSLRSELMRSCSCILYVSRMVTLTYICWGCILYVSRMVTLTYICWGCILHVSRMATLTSSIATTRNTILIKCLNYLISA
jgi:hypothetical protein